MAGNEGLPHSKKIHVIKHLTNIKIQSISVSKRTSSHNLQLTNTEKKPPPKRGDFFDPTWRIRQVNNFPHKKTLRSPKKRKGCPEGTLLKRPLWDFPTVYQNAKFLYDS